MYTESTHNFPLHTRLFVSLSDVNLSHPQDPTPHNSVYFNATATALPQIVNTSHHIQQPGDANVVQQKHKWYRSLFARKPPVGNTVESPAQTAVNEKAEGGWMTLINALKSPFRRLRSQKKKRDLVIGAPTDFKKLNGDDVVTELVGLNPTMFTEAQGLEAAMVRHVPGTSGGNETETSGSESEWENIDERQRF